MSSNIAALVDYTAYAAGLRVSGIRSVYGAGQDVYPDPFRPGQFIAAAPSNPTEPLSHWLELPTAPAVIYVSQEGEVELTWTIVMKLFFARADVAEIRHQALPFYDRYLACFVPDWRLGGLALRSQLAGFSVMGSDSDWAWLETRLNAVERVQY